MKPPENRGDEMVNGGRDFRVKEREKVAKHSHNFVETYGGFIGFGLGRETDERTVIYYLQKFSDDDMMAVLVKRMSNEELAAFFDLVSGTMKKHLKDFEYHELFLKDDHPSEGKDHTD